MPSNATPTFRADTISLSLTVNDLKQSAAWYCDVVGFAEVDRMERDGVLRSVSVTSGPVRLRLNQEDGAKGRDRKKGQGFSIYLTTSQEIDALATRIKSQGGALASEPADMPWGVRMITLQDPDGYRIVIAKPLA